MSDVRAVEEFGPKYKQLKAEEAGSREETLPSNYASICTPLRVIKF